MTPYLYNLPLIILACGIVAAMVVLLRFDQLRGTKLKNWLATFWSPDRQRVLHLREQNGFYFFVERLIRVSEVTVQLSWIAALPSFAGGVASVVIAAFLISLCFLIRLGCISHLATKRIERFSIPLDYDGFGVYAKTADEWRLRKREVRSPLILSAVAAVVLLLALIAMEL